MKILVAVDGSPCSQAAIDELCRRPWPPESEVLVVTVDSPLDINRWGPKSCTVFDELVKQQREETVKYLTDAVATIRKKAPHLPVKSQLLEGSAKEAIVAEAERWNADLIMVGSHGYGAVKRFFLGSVSLAVASNAPCSVEIIRCRVPLESEAAPTAT